MQCGRSPGGINRVNYHGRRSRSPGEVCAHPGGYLHLRVFAEARSFSSTSWVDLKGHEAFESQIYSDYGHHKTKQLAGLGIYE
jgi:hypothetical protein